MPDNLDAIFAAHAPAKKDDLLGSVSKTAAKTVLIAYAKSRIKALAPSYAKQIDYLEGHSKIEGHPLHPLRVSINDMLDDIIEAADQASGSNGKRFDTWANQKAAEIDSWVRSL